ncbi:hypothetical protein ASPZODRAFT_136116 [Penicilliopsis zonata CBS 506.65]|uniref:C2H2-type domain-containing protein n=1 Tax=Penicilliopsis zonata CBS 506.65 TaxID=1073090 RepID=A0A1L9S938_9EURO|nr:hypothetical protein ASPZODRAFT_136116 [Penicilliopsis zonata CBS 506.65]OJJ43664.1 hypothetical protein ASPZODRAFT_136116 [Penicilliopsis zonata CBS 506.65]
MTPSPPQDLLKYLPDHRVLVCMQCRYAIQPNAVARHLKEIHHIHRGDRRPFVEYAGQFDLADPAKVVYPDLTQFPVPVLPVENGVACRFAGCGHLCVTVKRMKQHWMTVHRMSARDGIDWRNVQVQTFFRGNALKYFTGERSEEVQPEKGCSRRDFAPVTLNFSPASPDGPLAEIEQRLIEKYHLDSLDSELLRHYLRHTSQTIDPRPETQTAFQTAVPKIAYNFHFLLQGMLSCAAMHLAQITPSRGAFSYRATAAKHHDAALPTFRHAMLTISSHNCNAVMAFSFFMMIYTLSRADDADSLLLIRESTTTTTIAAWMEVLRTRCNLLDSCWENIICGPIGPLASLWRHNDQKTVVSPTDPLLCKLLSIRNCSASFHPWNESDTKLYNNAAVELTRAISLASRMGHTLTIWDALGTWPLNLADGFFDLLLAMHPGALILLAQYGTLLASVQTLWFFNGHAGKLLDRVRSLVDPRWEKFLQADYMHS